MPMLVTNPIPMLYCSIRIESPGSFEYQIIRLYKNLYIDESQLILKMDKLEALLKIFYLLYKVIILSFSVKNLTFFFHLALSCLIFQLKNLRWKVSRLWNSTSLFGTNGINGLSFLRKFYVFLYLIYL